MASCLSLAGCLLLAVSSRAAAESNTRTWKLLHSFNGNDFEVRGAVTLGLSEEDPTVAQIKIENGDETVDAAKVDQMMGSGFYQLKLENEKSSVLTSVSACQLRRSNFRDEISVTLNSRGDAVSLAYAPLVSPLAPSCEELQNVEINKSTFESRIEYETATPGMTIPVILPPTKPQVGLKFFPRPQGAAGASSGRGIPGVDSQGNVGGTGQENQSFLFKYWYIILPLVIMSFVNGGQEEPPPQDGQQQQQTAQQGGAAAVQQTVQATSQGASGGARKRRGKRA